jgi:hypothetical protein
MRPQEIIAVKRDGGELSEAQIHTFIAGICDGSWADYQITALVMAMFTRGLTDLETEVLVREMLESGEVLDLSNISNPKGRQAFDRRCGRQNVANNRSCGGRLRSRGAYDLRPWTRTHRRNAR